jgi:hypothetical protein
VTPHQLNLPKMDGYESRSFKTTLSGTITDPKDQPARRPVIYDEVVGIFVGAVGDAGMQAAYIGKERSPIHHLKITTSQILLPLSEETKEALHAALRDIYEENRQAAHRFGLVDPEEEAEAAKAKAS